MTPRQIEKELERQKVVFEQEVKYDVCHDRNITFNVFADKSVEEYAKPKLAPKTVARYENFLKCINKAIGHKKLKDIKSLHYSNATLLIAESVDVRTVSQRFGHVDVSTTLHLYTRIAIKK